MSERVEKPEVKRGSHHGVYLLQKKWQEFHTQTLEDIKSEMAQSCEQMVDITKSAERKSYITLEKTFAIIDKHRGIT